MKLYIRITKRIKNVNINIGFSSLNNINQENININNIYSLDNNLIFINIIIFIINS